MTNENNKNAFIGHDVEVLFKESISIRPDVVSAIGEYFGIEGGLDHAINSGNNMEKADVILGFNGGRTINVNIKAYKNRGFNQLTRSSVSIFCQKFGLDDEHRQDLERIMVTKAHNPRNPLFSEQDIANWEYFFKKNTKNILEWGFSQKSSREILALYDRGASIMRVYPMKDVLKTLPVNIIFTKGGFNIGECVSFQRKGGNGSLSKHIAKTDIKHPGNNIQLKLKMQKLIDILSYVKLAEYKI